MKIKDGLQLRRVAGENVVLPDNETLDLNFMITLNDTGAFLWEKLQNETTVENLVEALLAEYNVDACRAQRSVENFLTGLRDSGFLEEQDCTDNEK